MFQIFAARMFEQRVLTAYREKVSWELPSTFQHREHAADVCVRRHRSRLNGRSSFFENSRPRSDLPKKRSSRRPRRIRRRRTRSGKWAGEIRSHLIPFR